MNRISNAGLRIAAALILAHGSPVGANDAAVESLQIEVGELRFSARAAGPPDGELVILLHGFPQTSYAFRHLLRDLAGEGFRAVAPDQRGYSAGARPEDVASYRIGQLIGDVVGLADSLHAPRFHLVGHDWGGAVAWGVAFRHPERLRSLTVLSTPHPAALGRARRESDQAERSSYMADLADESSETRLLANDAAGLREILDSPPIPAEDVEFYVRTFEAEGALRGALHWYRALLRPSSPGSSSRRAKPLRVPTLYLWGREDPVFSPAAARATADFVAGPYEFQELEGVGHWILEQVPDRVRAALLSHVGRYASDNRGEARLSTVPLDAELPSQGRLGGIAVDASGNVYVANFRGSVWRVDHGHVERLPLTLRGSSGNAVDAAGNLYQASFLDGRILRLAPDGTTETYVSAGLDGPVGIALADDGTLYVCNCRGNYVARVSTDRRVERCGYGDIRHFCPGPPSESGQNRTPLQGSATRPNGPVQRRIRSGPSAGTGC